MRLSKRKIDIETKNLSTTTSLHLGLQTYVVTSMRYAVRKKQNTGLFTIFVSVDDFNDFT